VSPWAQARLVMRGDLRHHIRDPLTMMVMVALPVVLFPALFWFMGKAQESQDLTLADTVLYVEAQPQEDGPALAEWLEPSDMLELRTGRLGDEDAAPGEAKIHVRVTLPVDGEAATISYRSDEPRSRTARRRVQTVFERARTAQQSATWAERGMSIGPEQVLTRDTLDVASKTERGGFALGRLIPILLIFQVLNGGLYTALDLFAGGKERGSLETLLTTRVDRRAILWARYALVAAFTLVSGVLALLSLWGSAAAGLIDLSALGPDQGGIVLSNGSLAMALLCLPFLATQLAGAMVVAAAYAPDFRTGQFLALPMMLLCLAPASVVALPTLELSPALALVPISNLALVIRDSMAGQAHMGMVALALVASAVHAGIALRIAGKLMAREAVLVGGGGAKSRRERGDHRPDVATLFALALLLLWFLGGMAQAQDVWWGTLFTQIGIFGGLALGGALVLGLPWKVLAQVRAPTARDMGLALVAALCAPAVGNAIARLQGPWLPTPSQTTAELEAALLEGHSFLGMLFAFALLPALCEEAFFRGTLQGLLRGSTGAIARCLIVGALFGFIHLDIVRILPTAVLGGLMAMAALRSGSLWVPVLIHLGNNAILLTLASDQGLGAPDWAENPPVAYLVGGSILALASVAAMGRGRS
jgi:sodium transport system permease protein